MRSPPVTGHPAPAVCKCRAFYQEAWAFKFLGLRADRMLIHITPFIRKFYGSDSTCLFYDERGCGHTVFQAKGGEQADPLMPGLFAVGVHALQEVASALQPLSFLDVMSLEYAEMDDCSPVVP